MLYELAFFFGKSKRIASKYTQPHQNTEIKLERIASHIKVTPTPWGKWSNEQYMSDIIIHDRNCVISLTQSKKLTTHQCTAHTPYYLGPEMKCHFQGSSPQQCSHQWPHFLHSQLHPNNSGTVQCLKGNTKHRMGSYTAQYRAHYGTVSHLLYTSCPFTSHTAPPKMKHIIVHTIYVHAHGDIYGTTSQ